ncbi:MAG: MarR family winged helix-turn-helix transcriptional regulator [Methylococcales bacterium]|nr:MarR family winged helix-turn-helix transcriptional regulator [Methylococcales bacterium]
MEKSSVFDLIERMSALIRSEERRRCTELGLQPVHLQVMDYLSRCNRYSDTPAALANYLGMTRGTVSQTILLLEKKGYLKKTADENDKRMVHLSLLAEGDALMNKASPADLYSQASAIFNENINQENVFINALNALQKANKSQSFGLCKTCKYFTETSAGFVCDLTKEQLSQSDSEKICQEHSLS